ncbi:hypothetical protein Lser_V15G11215 [Lactuca serriola]
MGTHAVSLRAHEAGNKPHACAFHPASKQHGNKRSCRHDLPVMFFTKRNSFVRFLLLLLFSLTIHLSSGANIISANQSLSGDNTIISQGGQFELGFFKAGNSSNYYIELKIIDGNLVLLNESKSQIWSTNVSTTTTTLNSSTALIRDDGNLVLIDSSNSVEPFWQSFDHPTHTWLPGAKLGYYNNRTKTSQVLTSWRSKEDPGVGLFSLELYPSSKEYVSKWNGSQQYWRSGAWNGNSFDLVPEMRLDNIFNYSYNTNENESYFTYSVSGTYPPMDTPRFSTRSQTEFHNGNPNSTHSQNISLTSENFTFPPEKSLSGPSPAKFGSGGLGREPSACSEIVRFSTSASGEIGRIPNEWSRCLLPLVRDKKVQIQGFCKSAPHNLGLMDTINLSISVYINSSILHTSHQTSVKAEFTPTDLYTRNQRLDIKDSSGVPPPLLNAPKLKNSSSNGSTVEPEETISDNDLDNIVGVANVSELEEMEPPNTLLCELRLYEKQALHFMVNLEKGPCVDDAATTLHPCWDAYHLADKRKFIVYVNSFSGEATVEFPSTLQMARGGTIMTISLLLAHTEKGRD